MNDRAFALQIHAENAEEHRKNVEHLKSEAEYLNESATDRFESSGWERSITLDCGCHVHIHRCDDGMESWWTERRWTLCDKHEAMGVEP